MTLYLVFAVIDSQKELDAIFQSKESADSYVSEGMEDADESDVFFEIEEWETNE